MTQATRLPSKRKFPQNASMPQRPASVGFETGTRYIRKAPVIERTVFNDPVAPTVTVVKRRTYVAPDASVILLPGTIERVALDDLEFNSSDKSKTTVSISQRIKDAIHKGSEAYTLYGVETGEIFTEEIELDQNIGMTAVERSDTGTNIIVSKETSRRIKKIKSDFEAKFRVFACKLYNLRIS